MQTSIRNLPPAALATLAAIAILPIVIVAVVALAFAGTAPTPAAAAPPQGCDYRILSEPGAAIPADKAGCLAPPTAQSAAPALAPLDALFDYRDANTRTTIDPTTIACIDGSSADAPGMVLVVIGYCDDPASPRAWVREADIPVAVGIRSMANLAPQPTPVPAPPVAVYEAPVYRAPAPAVVESAPPMHPQAEDAPPTYAAEQVQAPPPPPPEAPANGGGGSGVIGGAPSMAAPVADGTMTDQERWCRAAVRSTCASQQLETAKAQP